MDVSPRDIMYRLPADEVLADAGAKPHHLAQTDLRCLSLLLVQLVQILWRGTCMLLWRLCFSWLNLWIPASCLLKLLRLLK